MLEFSDKNFKEEVLKSKLPVVVDFWAVWCIDPQAIISINRRDAQFAHMIKPDANILSYNGYKIKMNKVIYSKISDALGHCKKIITNVSREIKVTDDHKFYTPEGWKAAAELKEGDKVAIYPTVEFIRHKYPRKVLITEKDIYKYRHKNMRINIYINELKNKGLLPLNLDNPNLSILVRLLGAQFSDGSLYCLKYNNYREISFSVGRHGDAIELKKDLGILGFKCTSTKKISNCGIQGRSFIMHSYNVRSHSTSLWLLLRALGASLGNKTNTAYKIPNWLMKANDSLQREFLAAYLGGDGPTPTIKLVKRKDKKPYNKLLINDIEFHKRTDLEESGLILAKQISDLLSKFGIKIKKVFSEDDKYIRKDNSKVKIIHIRISKDFKSGYHLTHKIGYIYSRQKSLNAQFVGEFLKKRLFERRLCKQKYKEAIFLFKKKKMDIKDIALKLNISPDTVFGWLRYGKNPTVFKHFEKYPIWLKEAKIGLNDDLLWERIHQIESINLKEVQRLILTGGHNFIANGFLVHNCGPCKAIAPAIEEIAAEFEGRVKIGKVNVDNNPEVTNNFNILNIPTLVFLKDGKETARMVGINSKAEIAKKIQELLK